MPSTLTLPPAVQQRLDELVAALQATLGPNLAALLVHGSAARGEYHPGQSDVDLLVVLKEDPPGALAAIGPALQLARFSARIEAMILRADEIADATDCFPLLYEDIARGGVLLAGTNPFGALRVDPEHRRLRIEQELREARIRLRRVVADLADEEALGRAVERKLKQARGPLWALLRLRGESLPEGLGPVLEAAGRAFALDVAPLRQPRELPHQAYLCLTQLLDRALAEVDALGVSR
jgi:predicted nucleotidyltransferase